MNEAHAGESTAGISAAAASRRAAAAAAAIVTVYEDGPLILRGQFVISAQDGQPIPAGRRTVALCRCGRSAMKPFCDGSHARTGFRAPGRAQGGGAATGDPAEIAGQPAAE
jgi:CDGSH-type Zn-finger protein